MVHTHMHLISQAKEKEAQKQQERAQEQDDDYTELSNHIHGDVLTENPDVAQSAFGGHRVIPDRWKGMSPAQVQDIRATQEIQKQEKEVHCFNITIEIHHTMVFNFVMMPLLSFKLQLP